jgi:cytochrome c oxidase accessory protein FixG
VTKKVIKHALWILVSAATGGAWIFYYADAPTLAQEFFVLKAPATAYFSMGFFTISTYLLGGIAREQVCTYMCPWPRIQGAMFDEESFLISYRKYRGEPRGAHKKGTSWDGRGDCVDCNQCVNVCPMGIDIRDGIQLECIQCALCIDACNDIMAKIGRPQGLIAYETSGNLERRAKGEEPEVKLIRPRTLVYMGIMAAIATLMSVSLITRSDVDVNIIRDRNPVFVKLSDGSIRNGFTIRVLNKQHVSRTFDIEVAELEGAILTNGQVGADRADTTITVGPDTYRAIKFFVSLPIDSVSAKDFDTSATIRFVVRDQSDGQEISEGSVFRGPDR